MKLLEEESETVADIEAEVLTYVSEMCVKFILGTEDIETKWDSYIETLKQFSIDEAVNCYQAAYDRYMEK